MSKSVLTDLDFNNVARLLNVPDATAPQQPATLAQLNAAIEGLSWKDDVRVSTQSNVNLAAPGATIDGITMSANDRVLVRSQSSVPENGIYIWNGAAVAMTRSLDANSAAELEQAVVTVSEGSDAGATFRQTQVNFTLGVSSVVWVGFGNSAPAASESTAGIAEVATQGETDTGTDDARIVTPFKLANWAGRKLKYAVDFGDGSATQYTVTHNLNTRDLTAEVRRNSGAYDEVICDVEFTTVNSVTLRFAAPVAINALRCIVLG